VALLSGTEVPSSRTAARSAEAEAPSNRASARSAGAEAPSDETLCPSPASPKTRERWTSIRSPRTRRLGSTGPLARLSKARRLPVVRAIPPASHDGRSRPGVRRPQLEACGAEAPYPSNASSDPRRPEGCSVSVDPAFFASTRRPNRFQRTLLPAPSSTEATMKPIGALVFEDRSPLDSSSEPKSLRIELLRSAFAEPKPRSNRTSGRDGPESFLTFRGLIPAAIRHSRVGCLGRRVARSSPGLHALQGVLPLCGRLGFHRAFPSWAS
jgi:hypothetical protein